LASVKFGTDSLLPLEGKAEQLVGQLLHIDPRVSHVCPQGITVDLVERTVLVTAQERKVAAAKHRGTPGASLYTVDFVVHFDCLSHLALEVKLDLHQGDDDYQEKLKDAAQVLSRFGYDFKILVIPADEQHPIWSNVPLVVQALSHRDLWPDDAAVHRIDDLQQGGARTGRDFVHALGLKMDHLPVLLASGALSHDLLGDQLKGNSLVAAAYGDLSHLQLIERLVR
jgi:hypothetical protein